MPLAANSFGKAPMTSAKPPVLIKGTASDATNNIFSILTPPLSLWNAVYYLFRRVAFRRLFNGAFSRRLGSRFLFAALGLFSRASRLPRLGSIAASLQRFFFIGRRLELQVYRRQRRQRQLQRLIHAVHGNILRFKFAFVEDVGAAEGFGIAVEYFDIRSLTGHAEAVRMADDGRKVAHDDGHIVRFLAAAEESDDAVVAVVAADPRKSRPVAVFFPEFGMLYVIRIQLLDVVVHGLVHRIFEQMPVEAVVVFPFDELAKVAAHEQELLAGMRHPVAVESPQAGKFLPVVAGHLVQERVLAVDDFVVRQGQDEVFRKGVAQGKRNEIMIILAEQRVHGHVAEHVVHPAHIPLIVESQAADINRLGHQRPGRRFFGDHKGMGKFAEYGLVQIAQEVDGFEVFPAAVLIGLPAAVGMAVVEIQHVGHGVDAQAVDVELAQPEHGAGNEEGLYFRPAVVEIHRVPFFVFRQHGVARFIAGLSVEIAQAVGIAAEMARHPVEDDADAVLMACVDEVHEVFRLAVAARRREVPRRLIAPRAVEGIFAQWHDFDVRIVHRRDVFHELVGDFAVRQHIAFFVAAPRAEMHFVGQHRLAVRVVLLAAVLPFFVLPRIAELGDFRGRVGAHFRPEGIGIALHEHFARRRRNGVFVNIPSCRPSIYVTQMPLPAPHRSIGLASMSHWLKSPTTLTFWA